MNIDEFVNNQTRSAYNSMMQNLLKFYQDKHDINLLFVMLAFGHSLEVLQDQKDGLSVNDIRDILKICFIEAGSIYTLPINRKDQHAEIQLLKGVIFVKHAKSLYESQKYDEVMNSLKTAYECFGASQVYKSDNLIPILDSDFKFSTASKGGKIKAEKYAEKIAPVYKKLEQYWDKGDWTNQKKKYSRFAEWAIHSEENEGLGYEDIRKYMSKYDKEK